MPYRQPPVKAEVPEPAEKLIVRKPLPLYEDFTKKRGRGKRRHSQISLAETNGEYPDEVFEILKEVDRARQKLGRHFLTVSEVVQVMLNMGYRRHDKRKLGQAH